MMTALARRIADFHRGAPTGPAIAAHAAPDALAARFAETLAILRRFVGPVLHPEEHTLLVDFAVRFVAAHEPLLRRRQEQGRIREGHGDLHAEHVCFIDAPASAGDESASDALPPGIYIFDCIEFSEPFRCNDVASEIAFLAMDLELRGRRDLADVFTAAYVAASGDAVIAQLLPYYAAFRACVRATVACLTSTEQEVAPADRDAARGRAEAYLALAVRCAWRAGPPAVIACCGLSGSGKSALAAALADATDFTWLRSDEIRRRSETGVEERYSVAARAAVYERLVAEADRLLGSGRGVIADATFLRRADRSRLAAVAARHGRRLVFVETDAPEAVVRARLAARPADDVSEARVETYLAQRRSREPLASDEPHVVVDAGGAIGATRAAAIAALWKRLRPER
jgi:predicted kinase